jgi:hypothetical protein
MRIVRHYFNRGTFKLMDVDIYCERTGSPEFISRNTKFNSFNVLDFEHCLPPDVQIRLLKQRVNNLMNRL